MRLNNLHEDRNSRSVLSQYCKRLQQFMESINRKRMIVENAKPKRVISERKITIEIDDSDETPRITAAPVVQPSQALSTPLPISITSKEEFIRKAQAIGDFSDPTWVSQLVNGMKQVGVQGLDRINNEDHPVGRGEIKQLINLLVELVSNK